MRYSVFPVDGGFGYRIIDNSDNVVIEQTFDPDKPGFELMDEDTASVKGQSVLVGYTIPEVANVQSTVTQQQQYTLGHVEFLSRFTSSERKNLYRLKETNHLAYIAGIQNNSLEEIVENLNDFFMMWDKASYIDLNYAPTIEGVTLLCTLIGMPSERIQQVLAK